MKRCEIRQNTHADTVLSQWPTQIIIFFLHIIKQRIYYIQGRIQSEII